MKPRLRPLVHVLVVALTMCPPVGEPVCGGVPSGEPPLAEPPAGDPSPALRDPVGLWTFDGALGDRGGAVRDDLLARDDRGAPYAGPSAPRFVGADDVPGVVGKAVALGVAPGDAEYLTADLSADLAVGPEYTIAAWIHPTELSGWNRLALVWGAAPWYAYHLAVHDGLASLYHGQAGGRLVSAEGGRVRPHRWHLIVGVAGLDEVAPPRGRLTLYLDGRRVATEAFDGTIGAPGPEGLGVGDSSGIPSRGSRFRGYIDELAIWRRALGPDEVRALHDARAEILRDLDAAIRERERARRAGTAARLEALGVREVVFAERASGRDPAGHYYANFGYSCIDPSYWIHGEDGGRLAKLDIRTGEATALLEDPDGAVRDPQVHHDAGKILFSYRRGSTHHYNLHEIDVDGGGLRRITSGPWDDVEPAYLPDGDIVFASTRCKRYIGCWLSPRRGLRQTNLL